MAKRLLRGLLFAAIIGPIVGVLAGVVAWITREFLGGSDPEFVSTVSQPTTGPRILILAEELILEELRRGSREGLTNAEIGELTGLNPVIRERRGEVTRSVLAALVERGAVAKDGPRYRLTAP